MSFYKWQIISCSSGHFHLVLGPGMPSWPFWSLETGLRLIDFALTHFWGKDDPELPLVHVQVGLMRTELSRLSKTQYRGSRGRFEKGFVLQRARHDFDQGGVAALWQDFFTGKGADVFVWHDLIQRPILINCSFIDRTEVAPGEIGAKPRTLEEVGVTVEAL